MTANSYASKQDGGATDYCSMLRITSTESGTETKLTNRVSSPDRPDLGQITCSPSALLSPPDSPVSPDLSLSTINISDDTLSEPIVHASQVVSTVGVMESGSLDPGGMSDLPCWELTPGGCAERTQARISTRASPHLSTRWLGKLNASSHAAGNYSPSPSYTSSISSVESEIKKLRDLEIKLKLDKSNSLCDVLDSLRQPSTNVISTQTCGFAYDLQALNYERITAQLKI